VRSPDHRNQGCYGASACRRLANRRVISPAEIPGGVHVEPHSAANEQLAWMLRAKMEFCLGSDSGSAVRPAR
jgi:hypothetical protein